MMRSLMYSALGLMIAAGAGALVFGSEAWQAMNDSGFAGANGQISAIVHSANNVYAGGAFSRIGTIAVSGIAHWNGSAWDVMGSVKFGSITALAVDSKGNVYAGGSFVLNFDQTVARKIAKWDGKAWSALGPGLNCKTGVWKLACDSHDNLYAVGDFDTAGSCKANGIACWNGTSWDSLPGAGARISFSSKAGAFAIDGKDRLYVGGSWGITRWDGVSWQSLTSGSNNIWAILCDSAGPVYAGGLFKISSGYAAFRAAKWNGAGWDSLGLSSGSSGSGVTGLALDKTGRLYAATGSLLMRLDNKTWAPADTGAGISGSLSALESDDSGYIWTGGSFSKTGNVKTSNLAVWNGATWDVPGGGLNGVVIAFARAPNGDIYAAGGFTVASGKGVNCIARWDGTRWHPLDAGATRATRSTPIIYDIIVDQAGVLYAGGNFSMIGNVPARNIAQWNGAWWDSLGSGIDSVVEALALDSNGNLYAGGTLTRAGGVKAAGVARWNGSSWDSVGKRYNVTALACDKSGAVYAGSFASYGISKWANGSWSTLGGGVSNFGIECVDDIVCDNAGKVYMSGDFDSGGNVPSRNVICWNGAGWESFGDSLGAYTGDEAYALALDDAGNLFAGGDLGFYAPSLFRWDRPKSHWSPLDGTPTATVRALAVYDGRLYVGGYFPTIGGMPSPFVANVKIATIVTTAPVSPESRPASPAISFSQHGRSLLINGIAAEDNLYFYSLRGVLLRHYRGAAMVDLKGLPVQCIVARIVRSGSEVKPAVITIR